MWLFNCFQCLQEKGRCSDQSSCADQAEQSYLLTSKQPLTFLTLKNKLKVFVKIKFIVEEGIYRINMHSVNFSQEVPIGSVFHIFITFYNQWLMRHKLPSIFDSNQGATQHPKSYKIHVVCPKHDEHSTYDCKQYTVSSQQDIDRIAQRDNMPESSRLIFEPYYQHALNDLVGSF